ncbi:uncharacterized protein EKO05_0000195 [Ascochyta rabiei]|uniref:Uncharacterized protein n=1 Tax=Didymella rabiei TaxID=5454 RepID=A0A163CAD9_DIDRA|nr:uncharacterized protein EKO05_0000195 [Ascochyta rabiei]KZM22320.1 hypothetical protein ST47_g6534 [Ascochyta rabiei]UPX09506.1 hypothetical protein EKO05_0000195 [Ascochyta rabiei]
MEDFGENDEMAAMMGFSSFGAKKRKFDQANSPKAQDGYSASGANSTELGVRTKASSDEQQGSEDPLGAVSSVQQTPKPPAPASGLASFLARGQALPEKPTKPTRFPREAPTEADPSASETVSFGGPSISRGELNTLKFGIKNESGDAAYFLPSFVEDPWERLLSNR